MSGLGAFALGVGAALVAQVLGPALGRRARPVVRGVIKQGIILSEGAQARTSGLREDLQDLVAEARLELRQQRQQRQQARSGGDEA
jgi:uncharacterized protein (DUF697 family)